MIVYPFKIMTCYIDYLNKKKNFLKDRKFFNSYEDATKWGLKNIENFNLDMIYFYHIIT
jgi:hypothetical protein